MKSNPSADLFANTAWRVIWFSIPIAAALNFFYGGPRDWLRLLLFTALTTAAQWFTPRSSMLALTLHSFGSMMLEFWMVADKSGILNRLGVHDLGFVTLAGLSVFGLSVQTGWRGLVGGGGFAAAGLVILNLFFGGKFLVYGALLLVILGWLGIGIHSIYRRLELANSRLSELAMLDALTGLENRRALEHSFPRQVASAERRSLPLLLTSWDLNGLKQLNDSQGHAAGDAHLRAFAEALRQTARLDDVCFRIGGDEFVGLHLGLHDGVALAKRVQKRFPSVAVGWVVVTDENLGTVLARADRAMYANKEAMKQHGSAYHTMESLKSTGIVEYRATLILDDKSRPN
jgi:diguanylate cyclase (GGDEF)-like protein